MVVLQILSFPASEAVLADKELIRAGMESQDKPEGNLGVWYGFQIEDGKIGYLAALWETFEHYEKHITTENHALRMEALKPVLAGPPTAFHFEPVADPTPALNSPVTEISTCWLKEGKEDRFEEDLKPVAEIMSKDLHLLPGSHGPIAWGDVIQERGKKWGIVIGWDTVAAHQALPATPPFDQYFTQMVAVAELSMNHVNFTKL